MCPAPKIEPPAPPPAPPPVLEQSSPKQARGSNSQDQKRKGLSRYKIAKSDVAASRTTQLGGIPKKTGV